MSPTRFTGDVTVWSGQPDTARLAGLSLRTGERRMLLAGTHARYAVGRLVFARADGLWAAPFDEARIAITGGPVKLLDSVRPRYGGAADFHVARQGTFVYVPGTWGPKNSLVFVDLNGRITPIADDHPLYSSPRVSPDGRRIAAIVRSKQGGFELWLYDVESREGVRLRTDGAALDPVWSRDGTRIAYASPREGTSRIYWVGTTGRSAPELLLSQRFAVYPSSWSPKGRLLAYHEQNPSAGLEVGVWSRESGPARVVSSAFLDTHATFSPDGRWLAYASNDTGRAEVYVAPYPPGAQRWRVSAGGGREPVWSPDGDGLFYRNLAGNQVLRVDIDSSADAPVAGRPQVLLHGAYADALGGTTANYDVAPDGRRFALVMRGGERPSTQIHVVRNWAGERIRDSP